MAAVFLIVGSLAACSGGEEREASASPIYGVRLPKDYRDWHVVGAAHETGSLNDIRVILGNDRAVEAFRTGQRPFPDGSIIARVAWRLVPSERNNAIFGRSQSFVAGAPTNVQIEVKDTRKFSKSGGWGYGQFENGRANPDPVLIGTCFSCHKRLPASEDFIFTHYSP